jgi:hypothetical protein
MTPTPEAQERIRRYLLGQLTDGAREEIEQNLLTNAELFEELLAAEDELIDEYLAGELPRDERVQFEQHFLAAPERQEKLRFARALNRYVTVASRQETSAGKFSPVLWSSRTILYRAAAAFAVVILIAGTLWLLRHRTPSQETFATLTLTISDSNRGDGAQAGRVKLLNVDALRIYLRLPNSLPPAVRYRVELVNETGEIRSLQIAEQDAQSVSVVIPAARLARGQYALRLFSIKTDGSEQRINGNYFFTVE